MPYLALPDRRMPYDADGTLVYLGSLTSGAVNLVADPEKLELQDDDFAYALISPTGISGAFTLFLFFPEQREVTGIYTRWGQEPGSGNVAMAADGLTGSNDTTNGLDGTWETASLPGGVPTFTNNFSWRAEIKAVSFTGPKKNIRVVTAGNDRPRILHLYGEAAGGQMAHDLIFIDQDAGTPAEFQSPEDFGDQPLGTTVVREWRVKNTSASRTATNVNLQCNDADFTIAENPAGPWLQTIALASLGPGVESPTYYVRCTTPAPGAPLKPRFARIIALCDAGFFG